VAYSIEGLTATIIAELVCAFRYKGEPNAEYSRIAARRIRCCGGAQII
jgi:hypothetical protein